MQPDLIVCSFFLSACAVLRTKQLIITTAAFCATVVFSYTPVYDLEFMDSFYIHIAYALILLPFIRASNIYGGVGLGIYAIFHCFIAYDYLFYPTNDTITYIYANSNMLHNIIDVCMIYLSIERGDNGAGSVDENSTINIHRLFGDKTSLQ